MTIRSFLRRLAPFVAFLGLNSPALAEEAGFDRNDADPALWVVEDADTKVYLFGTMHALKPDLVWFDDAVAQAFDSSDELVLEMLTPGEAEIRPVLAKEAMAAPDRGLSVVLSKEQYAKFASAATAIGIPAKALEPMKPWFAAITLSTAPLAKLGYKPDSGAETILHSAAEAKQMKEVGLETFAEQMGFFSSLSEEEQVEFLMSGIDEMPKMEETFAEMESAWARGDVEATAELLNESMEDTPKIHDVLIARRNAAWADWISKRMEQPGTVFVAVGAGHLAGDGSVQAMLGKKGMKVTRVEY